MILLKKKKRKKGYNWTATATHKQTNSTTIKWKLWIKFVVKTVTFWNQLAVAHMQMHSIF